MNQQTIESLSGIFELQGGTISLEILIVDAITLVVLSSVLALAYTYLGSSLSNRSSLARNLPLIALTTMMIIAIIKSSLTLSLGLVGALSIIRFRSAIKEPEELVYIFIAVAMGVGFGAEQRGVTTILFLLILILIVLKGLLTKGMRVRFTRRMYINFAVTGSIEASSVLEVVGNYVREVNIKRYDYDKETDKTDLLLVTNLPDDKNLDTLIDSLQEFGKDTTVSIFDDNGIFD